MAMLSRSSVETVAPSPPAGHQGRHHHHRKVISKMQTRHCPLREKRQHVKLVTRKASQVALAFDAGEALAVVQVAISLASIVPQR